MAGKSCQVAGESDVTQAHKISLSGNFLSLLNSLAKCPETTPGPLTVQQLILKGTWALQCLAFMNTACAAYEKAGNEESKGLKTHLTLEPPILFLKFICRNDSCMYTKISYARIFTSASYLTANR